MSVGKSIFYFCLFFLVSMVAGMSKGMLEDAEQEYYRDDNYVIDTSGPLMITLNPKSKHTKIELQCNGATYKPCYFMKENLS